MKKKELLTLFCFTLSFILGIGCAQAPKLPDIYWPSHPDPPRIKYIDSIISSRFLEETTFFQKVKETIAGGGSAQGMGRPFGVFAKNDRLYVADPIMRAVSVFDFKNKKYSMIGIDGNGLLAKPLAIFVDDSERIYVCDATAKRIMVYNKDFKFLKAIGKKGVFDRPGGVVVNEEQDKLYVTDILKHNVKVFDLKGNKLFTFGQRGIENGEFNYPTSMAISSEGEIYIVDSMNFRIQVFDPEGKFLRKFGQVGDQFGMFAKPKGIAIDIDGHIYVTDAAFNNIQIFDKNGSLLLFFSNMGYKRGELWMPAGITISENNKIYVADQYNHRINIYQYLTEYEGEKIKEEKEIEENKKSK